MRLRVALAVALLLAVGGLILGMSARAPRSAGSDHVSPSAFVVGVPAGGLLCQRLSFLPEDLGDARLRISTGGRPVPDLRLRLLDDRGAVVTSGHLPAGAHPGYVTIRLAPVHGTPVPTRFCLSVGGSSGIALGGDWGPRKLGSEVDGIAQQGKVSLLYLRPGEESWWQLLPTLSRRFGLGKASFVGGWTLPVAALLLLGVWVGTVRLLLRELA